MIFDNIENASLYYPLGDKIKKGFEFILNHDLKTVLFRFQSGMGRNDISVWPASEKEANGSWKKRKNINVTVFL